MRDIYKRLELLFNNQCKNETQIDPSNGLSEEIKFDIFLLKCIMNNKNFFHKL